MAEDNLTEEEVVDNLTEEEEVADNLMEEVVAGNPKEEDNSVVHLDETCDSMRIELNLLLRKRRLI